MKSKIIFKSDARRTGYAALSCLLALSLCVCANLSADESAGARPAKQKTEKSSQANTEKSDKKDDKSADKKDEKSADKKDAKSAEKPKPEPVIENVVPAGAEELVEKPREFLGKNVKFSAPFCSFTNLALDYKPALRPAKTHLSILVAHSKKNKIPLSELKLAMMTPGEKDPETALLAGLKEGDMLEITGKVFSIALDEPWVDILRLKKIGGSTDDKKADASGKAKINDTKASESKTDKTNSSKVNGDSKTPSKN
jgi:hypothetical protein